MAKASKRSQRTAIAPAPSQATANLPPNRILSVILEAEEDVEWTWTSTVDGVSYVSGYTLVKRENRGAASTRTKLTPKAGNSVGRGAKKGWSAA
ncbi:MAG: hypothetical protein EXR78_09220 [Deltaproteobacteria bacterium]|nr:hypothetical protein [Deltaproteobacteria bacterium]